MDKGSMIGMLVVAVLVLAGCEEEHQAGVMCEATLRGFQCTVEHARGSQPLKVCWDIRLECANGEKPVGHACAQVQPSSIVSQLVRDSAFTASTRCDQVTGMTVDVGDPAPL